MNHTGHLTEEQFAECALTPDPASEAHLATCAPCQAELAAFTAAMNDFGAMAARWSEAQPRVSLRAVQLAKQQHVLHHPATRWALAGILLVAVGVPVVLHGDRAPGNASDAGATAQMAADDSQAQIDQDNELMQSVNVALNTPEPALLAEYGLQPDVQGSGRASDLELRTQ